MQKNELNALFIGNRIIKLDSVDSTNNYALKLINEKKAAEGYVIQADYQSKGKGQRNSVWVSEPCENLLFSIILNPWFLQVQHQFLLNKAVCISIYDFITNHLQSTDKNAVKIKWPNDIYFKNKKLGGILIENMISGKKYQNAVVGIGLNINQTEFGTDLINPVSLKNITGHFFNIDDLLLEFLSEFENRYLQLKGTQWKNINEEYNKRLLFFDEEHLFKDFLGKSFLGKIIGINPVGKLIIDNYRGEYKEFDFKEIEF